MNNEKTSLEIAVELIIATKGKRELPSLIRDVEKTISEIRKKKV